MRSFIMPDDEDFDTNTEEGRRQMRQTIAQSARQFDPALYKPAGGAKGGVGKGRYLHGDTIHRIK